MTAGRSYLAALPAVLQHQGLGLCVLWLEAENRLEVCAVMCQMEPSRREAPGPERTLVCAHV